MKHMVLALLIVAVTALPMRADQPQQNSDAAGAPPQTPANPPPADALDRTMRELQELRRDSPTVAPQSPPGVRYVPSRVGAPSVRVDIDRSVLGVAPGQPLPTLRREGDFIVNRRGRLIRSPDGAHVLFRFEADAATSADPPMIMQPCRNLEAMENYVTDRGDTTIFIVSGQVHVYRGANYLLPTTWKLASDQGNLQP